MTVLSRPYSESGVVDPDVFASFTEHSQTQLYLNNSHLNTNFGNTENFHPLPLLPGSLRAAQRPRTEIFDKTGPMTFHSSLDIIARNNILALSLLVIRKRHNSMWITVSVTYLVLACFARSIGHPPHSSASPVELRLRVGPRALSEKKELR